MMKSQKDTQLEVCSSTVWYLSHCEAMKVHENLHRYTDSPAPSLPRLHGVVSLSKTIRICHERVIENLSVAHFDITRLTIPSDDKQ